MKKKHIIQILFFSLLALAYVVIFAKYVFAYLTEYVFDDNLFSGPMSGSQYISADLNFAYGWNNFWWKILFADIKQIPTETLILNGIEKTCKKQIRWYYINSARWLRPRPLDQDTLTYLQTIDPWYLDLTITWWLFICDGSSYQIIWNIQHNRKSEVYNIIAWVEYSLENNSYLPNYYPTLYFYWWEVEWNIYDSYGWIALVAGSGLNVSNVCGDWVSEWAEICDEWLNVNWKIIGHCNNTCDGTVYAICGNNSQEVTEACDDGANNWKYGYCNIVCTAMQESICGNNIKEWTEFCDDGSNNWWVWYCSNSCSNIVAPSGWWGWGGGGSSSTIAKETSCPLDLDCSQEKYIHCTKCIKKLLENVLPVESPIVATEKSIEDHTSALLSGDITDSKYSSEINNAYQWAYGLWITTIPNINNANMDWKLIRKHAAKMISQFAIKTLDKSANNSYECTFLDMQGQTKEMKYYATISCKLGIMWLKSDGTPDTKFNPDGVVTRAQFATMLSRILYGNKYNTSKWVRYEKHLNALNSIWVINKISNPQMLELRWYVLLMMKRVFDLEWK